LTKNVLTGEMKRDQYSLRSGLVKEYAGERYYRQNVQLQRWQAEHQQHEAVEKALADVSKFGYDPEDYVHYVNDPPTELSYFKNSPGYRLILNNVLFPASQEKKKKT